MTDAPGLDYDRAAERWWLRGRALHCGDGLEVRIEYHDRHHWVLHADGDAVRVLPSRCLPARPDPRDHRW